MLNTKEYFENKNLSTQELTSAIKDHYFKKMELKEEHTWDLIEILDFICHDDLIKIYYEEVF